MSPIITIMIIITKRHYHFIIKFSLIITHIFVYIIFFKIMIINSITNLHLDQFKIILIKSFLEIYLMTNN